MSETLQEHRTRVHQNKREWHQEQARLPVQEKVRLLIQLQRNALPIIAARRPLKWYEKPWEIEP